MCRFLCITGPWALLFVAFGARHAFAGNRPFRIVQKLQENEDGDSSNDVGDLAHTCDVDAVQGANVHQLHPILHDLVNTTFFRLFRVNLKNPSCPFWESASSKASEEHGEAGGSCKGNAAALGFDSMAPSFMSKASGFSFSPPPEAEAPCGVDAEEDERSEPSDEDDKLDRSMTFTEQVAAESRDNESSQECEFEEDLPTYWIDMCSGESDKDVEDVNLIKNPERNTGYNGSHIWEAMYSENCFEVGSSLPRGRYGDVDSGMCYEERVLYRLLSGWHASTTLSIAKSFYAPGTKKKGEWAPKPELWLSVLEKHPEVPKNLHFSFVVILRAVKKASAFLQTYHYSTGDDREDKVTKSLMNRLLDSQVLSLCSPLFEAFDETSLFRNSAFPSQRSLLKRQFKSVFQNITVLVDCVQCQRCRLHAKLFSLGLGSALKILLTPPDLISVSTSRDEVVALLNVLWKLSDAMLDARLLTQLAAELPRSADDRPSLSISQGAPSSQRPSVPPVTSSTGSLPAGDAAIEATVLPERLHLLDLALTAVRKASGAGSLPAAAEEAVLRSLVVQPASAEVLLLAKHYAVDRPDLFAKLAHEVASASPDLASAQHVLRPMLGSPEAPADVVIIGGGLAGMVAAMTLLDRGASVIMIEKQPYLGGNSGKASSGINAALETSVESLAADTTKSAGSLKRPLLIEKLASDSAPAVSWLRDRTGVDLSMRSQLGGHSVQRTLRPSNAFVGAEITFAAGQILNNVTAERPDRFRLLTKAMWSGLAPGGAGWRATFVANGTETVVEATSAVIATGGFGHDVREAESLLAKYRPDLVDYPTTLGPQTTGDGVKIARDLGARLVDMDRVQLHPTGFVDPSKREEHTKTLAAELLRGVGGLLLDRNGDRFTDELGTRQAVVNAELKRTEESASFSEPEPARAFALVLNGKAAKAAGRHVTLYSKKGLLTKVEGLAGLAAHLSVSATQLNTTFADYNAAARQGKDRFGRTVFPDHWPVEQDEEFYVGMVVPVIHYTMGGVEIDTEARVLSETDGKPIAGLYAIGEASGGVHGDNRLAGNSLLECTVFGRQVGLTLPISSARANFVAEDSTPVEVAAQDQGADASPGSSSPEAPLRRISAEELSEHKSQEQGAWVALYGKVYALADYVDEHPGGAEAILDVAGGDGTETFESVHNRELLDSMGFAPIGELVE